MLRYTVNELSTMTWSFEEDARYYSKIGVPAITPQRRKLEPHGVDRGIALLKEVGLTVAAYQTSSNFNLNQRDKWPAQIAEFKHDIETTTRLGTDLLIFQTGPPEGLSYEEAERHFIEILNQLLPEAERRGVRLAVEHNSALRVDLGFLGSFHNALDLADAVNSPYLTVCFEINNGWAERHLYDNIQKRIAKISIAQIDDFKEGTFVTPSRVPLGDGIIPLQRIIDAFLEAGYDSYFDVELIGPHIEDMGYEEALRRCVNYVHNYKLP